MTAVVGLIAGGVAWFLRRARGVYVAVGLAVGGIVGAPLTELVGWALRGDGHRYSCGDGSFTCIDHLPLTVHMHALLFLEAIAALLVYGSAWPSPQPTTWAVPIPAGSRRAARPGGVRHPSR